jgi:Subtilase family/Domain of unknown function (DUF4384)
MKRTRAFQNAALRAILASVCLSLSLQAQDLEQLYRRLTLRFSPPASTNQTRSIQETGNPKIAPELRRLVLESQTKSLRDLSADARAIGIPMDNDRVAVVATADTEADVPALRDRITQAGGTVVAIVDSAVLARVPTDSIDRIGSETSLAYLGPQAILSMPPEPQQPASTRGIAVDGSVALTKANLLHKKGVRGAGVKVGLLDFGFTGYKALQAQGVLPEPKAVKSFGKDQGWDRVDTGTEHGAACAEIIHAMAPDADLYIASIGDGSGRAGDDEIILAAMWLAEQHVDIISFSGGGTYGPFNGTSLLDKLVENVVGKGILWVNSAGNEGDYHWSIMTQLDKENLVMVEQKPYLFVQATGSTVAVQVSWDDWGADPLKPSSTQDFDVLLASVDANTGDVKFVSASQNPQTGNAAPVERVQAAAQPGQLFAVFILGKSVNRSVRMHFFGLVSEKMFPHTAERSLTIPATSPYALSVAAVNANTVKLETFSSQGPTDDGRAKPEIAAPDGAVSKAYKSEFFGTSAACPHAAGFAALIRQLHRDAPPLELQKIILEATSQLSDNRGAGRGMIDGGRIGGGGGRPGGSNPSSNPLTALLNLATDDNQLGVKVVVGRPEYQIGDGLKIGYRANRDAYCVLVHRSSLGEYTPLLPRDGEELRLRAGERYSFPDGNTTIRITGPPGTDEVGLICSPDRFQLDKISEVNQQSLSVNAARYKVVEQ